jgi:hypothetical protein
LGVASASIAAWLVTESWEMIAVVTCTVLGGVVLERNQEGLFAAAILFAILVERNLLSSQELIPVYFAVSSLCLALAVGGTMWHHGKHSPVALRFLMLTLFARLLFSIGQVPSLCVVPVFALMRAPWQQRGLFPLVLAGECALCAVMAYIQKSAVLPFAMFVLVASGSVLLHVIAEAPPTFERPVALRLAIGAAMCAPLVGVFSTTEDLVWPVLLHVGLASIGALGAGLDVLPDLGFVGAVVLLSVPTNFSVGVVTLGALMVLMPPSTAVQTRTAAVVAQVALMAVLVVAEEVDLNYCGCLLALCQILSRYSTHRAHVLHALGYRNSPEVFASSGFAWMYVGLVGVGAMFHQPRFGGVGVPALLLGSAVPGKVLWAVIAQVVYVAVTQTTDHAEWWTVLVFTAYLLACLQVLSDPDNVFWFAAPFLVVLLYLEPELWACEVLLLGVMAYSKWQAAGHQAELLARVKRAL